MICAACLVDADPYAGFESVNNEGYLQRCLHCRKLLFVYESQEDLTFRFEAGHGTEAIAGIVPWIDGRPI